MLGYFRFRWLLATALICSSLYSPAGGIKCYICTSIAHIECLTAGHDLKECSLDDHICLKKDTLEESGLRVIVRKCAIDTRPNRDADSCRTTKNGREGEIKETVCFCKMDTCNSGNSVRGISVWSYLWISILNPNILGLVFKSQ